MSDEKTRVAVVPGKREYRKAGEHPRDVVGGRFGRRPKFQAGLTIAYGSPTSASAGSTSAARRKYPSGESIDGLETLRWTLRAPPARRAA
ncbi:MAG: hypothetical protein M3018_12360 [Actinomycetota bacterium]|nr:hypothetical protein [Actinomycetota bacterium]